MNDVLDLALKALPALVPLVTVLITLGRGPGALRDRIKHDVELVEKLPDSRARDGMLDLVEREVRDLNRFDATASRDLPMFGLSLVSAPLLGYLTLWLIRDQHGWWTVPTAVVSGLLALLFVYGIFETGQRVPRDKGGKRLELPTLDGET